MGGLIRSYEYGLRDRLMHLIRQHRWLAPTIVVALVSTLAIAGVVAKSSREARRQLAATLRERADERRDNFDWELAALFYAQSLSAWPSREAELGLALVDTHTRQVARKLWPEVSSVLAMAFSKDGEVLAIGTQSGDILLESRGVSKRLSGTHDRAISAIEFLKDGAVLSSSTDGRLVLWTEGTPRILTAHRAAVNGLAIAADERSVAIAVGDGTFAIYRLPDGELLSRSLPFGTRARYDITLSPDGTTLAIACWDGSVGLANPNGQVFQKLLGHGDAVLAVKWSPDGTRLASASRDNTIRLWSKDGTALKTLLGHKEKVEDLLWLDAQYLLSTSLDQTTRLWDTRDGSALPSANEELHQAGTALAYHATEGIFVAGSRGVVARYTVPAEATPTHTVWPSTTIEPAPDGGWLTLDEGQFLHRDPSLQTLDRTASKDGHVVDFRTWSNGQIIIHRSPDTISFVKPNGAQLLVPLAQIPAALQV